MSTNNSILKDMKQALINAHKSNNAKAISKDFAAGSGVSEKAFTSWTTWIETLHVKVSPWAEKWNDGKVTDDEIQQIMDDVMPVLKQINRVDDKLFIRSNDLGAICKMVHDFGKSNDGTVDVVKGKVSFRRQIEAMIGMRLSENQALTEDEYNTVVKYDRAVVNKEKAENRLNGYTDKKGAKVIGLKDQLKEAEKKLEDIKKSVTATYKKFNAVPTEDDLKADEGVALATANVENIKNNIKATEGNITKAKETIKKLEKSYKEIMSKKVKAIK